jgi:FKBP-type peptidyl-prolyl cis-trans isomerase FkpA
LIAATTFSKTHVDLHSQFSINFKKPYNQMNRFFSSFLFFAFVISFSACSKSEEVPPCTYDECAFKAPASEIVAMQAYLDSAGITGTTQHCSGLFYKIEASGTGKTPDPCLNSIVARYKGTLTNGTEFESGQFQQPIPLGGGLITGWVNGLPLIKESGRIILYVPPSLGYGSQIRRDAAGNVTIPANSITIFDVELLTVY